MSTGPPSEQGPAPLVLDVSDTPEWLRLQYAKFVEVSIPPEAYAAWNAAVTNWVKLERALAFSTVRVWSIRVINLVADLFFRRKRDSLPRRAL